MYKRQGQDWQAETEIRRETLLLLLCFRTKLARRSSSKLKPKTLLLCIGGAFKGSGDSVCVCVYVHVGGCMQVCVYVYALNKLCTCHVQWMHCLAQMERSISNNKLEKSCPGGYVVCVCMPSLCVCSCVRARMCVCVCNKLKAHTNQHFNIWL